MNQDLPPNHPFAQFPLFSTIKMYVGTGNDVFAWGFDWIGPVSWHDPHTNVPLPPAAFALLAHVMNEGYFAVIRGNNPRILRMAAVEWFFMRGFEHVPVAISRRFFMQLYLEPMMN